MEKQSGNLYLVQVKAKFDRQKSPINSGFIDGRLVSPYNRNLSHSREDDLGVQEQLGSLAAAHLTLFNPDRHLVDAIKTLIESANIVAPLDEYGLTLEAQVDRSYKTPGEVMRAVAEIKAAEMKALTIADQALDRIENRKVRTGDLLEEKIFLPKKDLNSRYLNPEHILNTV